jgi:hypothetical protein
MTAKTPKDDVYDLDYRDMFAMCAMIGLTSRGGLPPHSCAETAYMYADAMLKERKHYGFENTY